MRNLHTGIFQLINNVKVLKVDMKKTLFNCHIQHQLTRCYTTTNKLYYSVTRNEKFSSLASQAKIYSKDEMLYVINENEKCIQYPWVWLRDNCQCKSCFNPQARSRTIDWKDFNTSIQPTSVLRNDDVLNVTWSDGHESQYTLKWLQEREFSQEIQEKWLHNVYRMPQIPWNASSFPEVLKRIKYNDVMESDEYLFYWLKSLATFGIAIIEDTPPKEDQLKKLADRIGFIKKTHYGEKFEVKDKPDTTNLAYLAIPLQMHSDMPYYEYKPGINMLHCLEQIKEGGENQFTDCLYINQLFKENHPEIHKILSRTPVDWSDIGEERGDKFYTYYRAPVICEDINGQFIRVNYNQWQRDSHFSIPLEEVGPWYNANAKFTQALYDPKNMVQFKAKPGEIVTFDNIRLLHARTGYKDSSDNKRHLIGSYLDWDIVFSRIRILQKQYQ